MIKNMRNIEMMINNKKMLKSICKHKVAFFTLNLP